MAQDLSLTVKLGLIDKIIKPLRGIQKNLAQTSGALKGLKAAEKSLASYTALKSSTQDTSRAMEAQQQQVKELTRQIEATEGPTRRLTQQRNAATKTARKLGRQYDQEQTQLRTLRGDLNRVGGLTGTLSDQEAQLASRIKVANDRISRQRKALRRLGEADVVGKFSKMTSEVGRLARRITFGAGAAVGGIFALANSTAGLGDNIAKTADKIGIGLAKLQELRYAAERSGVSTQMLDSSFERFVKRIGEAAQGAGAAKKAYDQLGLSAEDLANMAPDKAFGVVADRLKDVSNQTERVAIAAQLFGREGVAMVNMVKNGSAGLRALGEDARATGYILSEQAARDAEVFKDRLLDAQLGITGMKNTIGAELMPALSGLMQNMAAWMRKNSGLVREFANSFGKRLKEAIPVIADLARGLASAASTMSKITRRAADMVGGFDNLGMIVGAAFAGKAIVSVLSFGGALFKAGAALASLSTALPAVAAGIRAIGVALAANPIGLAIAVLVGAAYLIYKHWGAIAAFFANQWAAVKQAFSDGVGVVAQLLTNWSPFGAINRAITASLEALAEIPDKFRTLGSAIVEGIIGGITAMGGALYDSITGLGSSAVGWFKDKLGINSPSRVFMGFGENTVEGYRLGVVRNQQKAINDMSTFGQRVRRMGAGIALGAVALPAAALPSPMPAMQVPPAVAAPMRLAGQQAPTQSTSAPTVEHRHIRFDNRPPIASSQSSGAVHISMGGITINAAPGMDENALARLVGARVDRRLREAEGRLSSRRRSALFDQD